MNTSRSSGAAAGRRFMGTSNSLKTTGGVKDNTIFYSCVTAAAIFANLAILDTKVSLDTSAELNDEVMKQNEADWDKFTLAAVKEDDFAMFDSDEEIEKDDPLAFFIDDALKASDEDEEDEESDEVKASGESGDDDESDEVGNPTEDAALPDCALPDMTKDDSPEAESPVAKIAGADGSDSVNIEVESPDSSDNTDTSNTEVKVSER